MEKDSYHSLAERYDWMKQRNPVREKFFSKLFARHDISNVLDCACGTAQDLILFRSLGCDVYGSDLSDAMLSQARKNLADAKLDIHLRKMDYRELDKHYHDVKFDAVVCLANSINESLCDEDTVQALKSMASILREGGVVVFDQGQSDAMMKNPPRFAPIVNERDFTRFFTMKYSQDVMTVNIFDFIHTQDASDFKHVPIRVKIRLQDDWRRLLQQAGLKNVEYFGDWDSSPYDKESSSRLIALIKK